MNRKIRVLIAKAGLDGHQAGIRIVAQALRDAGMEVIYLGLYNTAEQIVETARQEAVDVIGLSSLSGAHRTVLPRVADLARQKGLQDVLLIAGGVIPNKDIPDLEKAGVARVFKSGSPLGEIVDFIKQRLA
ncbi:MAG: cobalamin B12-binding domain-containing protein [Thermodesulfobacteriota bacterium]